MSLEDICSEVGVEPAIGSRLVQDGWNVSNFGMIASNIDGFTASLEDLLPGQELSLLQRSSLKAVFQRCRPQDKASSVNTPGAPEGATASKEVGSSWAESFPPKLDSQTIHEMKSKFLSNYPSELLNQETTPSTRLLSLVHHQLAKRQWQWIPWKYRLSQAKVEELQTQRAAKMPKLESLTLGALMIDDVPSLEIRNEGMGLHAVRTLMDIHNVALAMCGAAHLAALKEYSQKFLSLLTQKVEPELGLRNANIIESQSADRQCWYVMSELINERQWSMNDALHEITHIRHDLSTLLQLRPRPPKALTTWSSSTSPSSSKGSKGKGKSSSKSSGKSNNASKGKNAWITEIKLPDGSRKQLCINFQSGRCHRADCKFAHSCAYPMTAGTACGKNHSAQQHQSVSH